MIILHWLVIPQIRFNLLLEMILMTDNVVLILNTYEKHSKCYSGCYYAIISDTKGQYVVSP